jgi:hypothetical protein
VWEYVEYLYCKLECVPCCVDQCRDVDAMPLWIVVLPSRPPLPPKQGGLIRVEGLLQPVEFATPQADYLILEEVILISYPHLILNTPLSFTFSHFPFS